MTCPTSGWSSQPGVINLWMTQRVAPQGYYYAPDPSSQQVCSIGGNVAENSGGAHCLKYGFTVNHVLGMKVVLADGELVELGGPALDSPGYDLPGIFVGSEGTLGIATEITLRLLRKPEAVQTALAAFGHTDAAGRGGLGHHRGGHRARRRRDDGSAGDRGGGGGRPRGLPARRGRRVAGRAGRARGSRWSEQLAQVEAICREAGRDGVAAGAALTRSAR